MLHAEPAALPVGFDQELFESDMARLTALPWYLSSPEVVGANGLTAAHLVVSKMDSNGITLVAPRQCYAFDGSGKESHEFVRYRATLAGALVRQEMVKRVFVPGEGAAEYVAYEGPDGTTWAEQRLGDVSYDARTREGVLTPLGFGLGFDLEAQGARPLSVGLAEYDYLSTVEVEDDSAAAGYMLLQAEMEDVVKSPIGRIRIEGEAGLSMLRPIEMAWYPADHSAGNTTVAVEAWLPRPDGTNSLLPERAVRCTVYDGSLSPTVAPSTLVFQVVSFDRDPADAAVTDAYCYSLTQFPQDLAASTSLPADPASGLAADPIATSSDDNRTVTADELTALADMLLDPPTPYDAKSGGTLEAVKIAHNISGWSTTLPTAPVPHNLDVDLRAVVKLTGDANWYWNHPDGYGFKEWTGSAGSVSFVWDEVVPTYSDYSNTEPPPWHYDEFDDYTASSAGTGWDLDNVGGTTNVGVMRYAVEATLTPAGCGGESTVSTPDEDDTGACGVGDDCIDDTVFMLAVKGDYTPDILKYAAAQINVPFVMGSAWSHQTKRYVGCDCADMAGHAMFLSGASGVSEPYAQGLYGWATADPPENGLDLVTDWTLYVANQIPEPSPGNTVLIDYDYTGSGIHVANHTTVFESGGDSWLGTSDNTIMASSKDNKVEKTTYANASLDLPRDVYVAVLSFAAP